MATFIAFLYGFTGVAAIAGYVPQIIRTCRSRDGARDLALSTWGVWLMGGFVTLMYGALVVVDPLLVLVSSMNLMGCAAVFAAACAKRYKTRRVVVAALSAGVSVPLPVHGPATQAPETLPRWDQHCL